MKKLKNREKLLVYLLLVVAIAVLIWFVVLDKYTGVDRLNQVKIITPSVDHEIEVRNTVKTTVSVVEPPDEETAE